MRKILIMVVLFIFSMSMVQLQENYNLVPYVTILSPEGTETQTKVGLNFNMENTILVETLNFISGSSFDYNFHTNKFYLEQFIGVGLDYNFTKKFGMKVTSTYGLGLDILKDYTTQFNLNFLFKYKVSDKVGLLFGQGYKNVKHKLSNVDSVEFPLMFGFEF